MPLGVTRCGSRELHWGKRTYIMGIVNLTPDSFSGDGLDKDVDSAVALTRRLEAEGADVVDVGGESTRPRAVALSVEAELERVIPAIRRLVAEVGVPVSVDTYKGEVARQAVAAGAAMVNDVWGKDPEVARVAAEAGVPLVLTHNQEPRAYRDVVAEVVAGLRGSMERALAAGVSWENIIIDPGIGFGKAREHNLELLGRLEELASLGRPILLGTSRKFALGLPRGAPVAQRIWASAATVAIGIAKGCHMVRVHDVKEMALVCRMSDAVVRRVRP